MKHPLHSLTTVALLATAVVAPDADAHKCGVIKSAHCRCRAVADEHRTTGSVDNLIQINARGTVLYTYTSHKTCVNPQWDSYQWRINKGCWKVCRDAHGVEGARGDPEVVRLKAAAAAKLRAMGACGGWYQAVLEFAAGRNKWRSATGAGIGIGGLGTVSVVNGKKVCR